MPEDASLPPAEEGAAPIPPEEPDSPSSGAIQVLPQLPPAESLPAPPEPTLSPPARPPRPRPAPPAPHPGFWWAILWCGLMMIVAQVLPTLAVMIVSLIVKAAQLGSGEKALEWLADPASARDYLAPALAATQISLTLFSLTALRLVAGRDWARQVGLRLPSPVHLLLALIGVPALWLSAAGAFLAVKELMPGLPELPNYALTFLGVLAVVSLYWLAVRLTTGRDWTRELQRLRPGNQAVLAVLGLALVVVTSRTLFLLLKPWLPEVEMLKGENPMVGLVKDVRNWPPAVAVLVIGLGPGIGEELFCRAFLGRGLVGRHGVVMGVVLTSLFFGLIHGDPHQGTMAALMGIALHFAYLTSRSLLIPMLLHFLNNSLSVIADKLPEFARQRVEAVDSDPDKVPYILFLGAGLLLAAVAWAMYRSRARLVPAADGDGPAWRPPFPGPAWPPPGSGTRVQSCWPGWLPSLAVLAGMAALALCFYQAAQPH